MKWRDLINTKNEQNASILEGGGTMCGGIMEK
jgi:hypothetical protein